MRRPPGSAARTLLPAVVALLAACGSSDERASSMTPSPALFAAAPTIAEPTLAAAPTPASLEPLPRNIADVELGMSRADVQKALGELDCHANPAGFEVCRETTRRTGVEIYFHHERVLSISSNAEPPEDVWSYLERLMARYGQPSLKGLADRDQEGRLHEIYGWKDERTLLSVRFVWVEEAPNPRQLTATALTVWDRKAYDAWEKERGPHPHAPENAPEQSDEQQSPERT